MTTDQTDVKYIRWPVLIVGLIVVVGLVSGPGSGDGAAAPGPDAPLCEYGSVQIRLVWRTSMGPTLAGHFDGASPDVWLTGSELRQILSKAPGVSKAFASQRAMALMIKTPAPVLVAALLADAIVDASQARSDHSSTPLLGLALTATGLTLPALVFSDVYHTLWAIRTYNSAVAQRCPT